MHSHEGDEEDVLRYTRVYSILTSMHAGNEYTRYTLRSSEYIRAYSLLVCILTHNVHARVSPNWNVHTRTSTCILVFDHLPPNMKSRLPLEMELVIVYSC